MEDTMKFAAHVLASLSLGSEHGSRSEAIVVFPGKHQLWRVETGIRVWSTRETSRLWVAGTFADPFYTRQDILDLIKKGLCKCSVHVLVIDPVVGPEYRSRVGH